MLCDHFVEAIILESNDPVYSQDYPEEWSCEILTAMTDESRTVGGP
jgi:hypothetical protein